MPIDRRFRIARIFSNRELQKFAGLFSGQVVNVSAGDDLDKEGTAYKNYFTAAAGYTITNWAGKTYRGYNPDSDEISLDLQNALPDDLVERFEVVFNHTTLEHIRHAEVAFANLCKMSKDVVIVVVPFAQLEHETPGYFDYWRFSPRLLRELFAENGFEILYENANRDFNAATYLFFIASRHPEKWTAKFPPYKPTATAAFLLGEGFFKYVARRLLGK